MSTQRIVHIEKSELRRLLHEELEKLLKPNSLPRYWRIQEAAEKLRVTRTTIYTWLKSGKLTEVYLAGYRYVIPPTPETPEAHRAHGAQST